MSDEDRRSIGPDDWPLEEGSAEMRDGLRNDIGASQSTPRDDSLASAGPTADAADDDTSDRGPLGTATPGSKGIAQGSR